MKLILPSSIKPGVLPVASIFLTSRVFWRRVLIVLAVIVTLLFAFYTIELIRGRSAWNRYVEQAKAEGKILDWQALIPPPAPDEQNFASLPLFQRMFDYNPRAIPGNENSAPGISERPDLGPYYGNTQPEGTHGNWKNGRRVNLQAWQNYYRNAAEQEAADGPSPFPVPDSPESPAEDVLTALSIHEPVLDELRQASRRPQARFPIHYEENFNALLPHLAMLRSLAGTLQIRSIALLATGDSAAAFQDLKLGFYLEQTLAEEPLLISQLIRMAIHSSMLQTVWEGMLDHRWNEDQLIAVQNQLQERNWLASTRFALQGERAFSLMLLQEIRLGGLRRYAEVMGTEVKPNPLVNFFGNLLFPDGWIYQNMLYICRAHDQFLLGPIHPKSMRVEKIEMPELERFIQAGPLPYTFFARTLLPALAKTTYLAARAQSYNDLASVACALERHRLKIGHYPESLAALIPDFLESLPHDVMTGNPLHYSRPSDQPFLLNAVGWDRQDNGGTYNENDRESGDWVWPSHPNRQETSAPSNTGE